MSISQFAISIISVMDILRLKKLRLEAGLTQQQLADQLSIRQNTYSQYESGQRQLPLDALVRLAKLYNVSVDYLLGLTDVDTPYPR